MNDVKHAMSERIAYECMLGPTQKVVVSIFSGNQLPYASFQCVGKDASNVDHGKTVNMNESELGKMMENVNSAQHVIDSYAGDLARDRMILQHNTNTAIELPVIRLYYGKVVYKSGQEDLNAPFLDREKCEKNLAEVVARLIREEYDIDTYNVVEKTLYRPNRFHMIEAIVKALIRKDMGNEKQKKCPGCINEQGNQEGHDCTEAATLEQIDEMRKQMTPEYVLPVLQYIMTRLGYGYIELLPLIYDQYIFSEYRAEVFKSLLEDGDVITRLVHDSTMGLCQTRHGEVDME
jgi:hypothetical protein